MTRARVGAADFQWRPVAGLIPYARNSRTHSDAQVAQIAASIREFGFNNPVLVDAQGGIIAGHGRVLAARKLGMVDVPCIELGHLTETQRRAYVIADNRIALNAGWDEAALALEMAELQIEGVDLELLGFDSDEVESLLGGDDSPGPKVWEVDDTPVESWLFIRVQGGPENISAIREAIERAIPGAEYAVKVDYRDGA